MPSTRSNPRRRRASGWRRGAGGGDAGRRHRPRTTRRRTRDFGVSRPDSCARDPTALRYLRLRPVRRPVRPRSLLPPGDGCADPSRRRRCGPSSMIDTKCTVGLRRATCSTRRVCGSSLGVISRQSDRAHAVGLAPIAEAIAACPTLQRPRCRRSQRLRSSASRTQTA